MKKYTLIIRQSKRVGSHTICNITYKRIETDNIGEYVYMFDDGEIEHIFEGHPKLEGE